MERPASHGHASVLPFRNFEEELARKGHGRALFTPEEFTVDGEFAAACQRAEEENMWLVVHVVDHHNPAQFNDLKTIWNHVRVRWIMSRHFRLWTPTDTVLNTQPSQGCACPD